MPETVIYGTDLHGEVREYERLLETAKKKDASAVMIGGDITPFLSAIGDIAIHQREFMEFFLIPRLLEFRENNAGMKVFMMMGNDDLKINMDLLKRGEKKGAFSIMNQKVHRLGKFFVAGYSYVNETPFLLKDWEKPEKSIAADLNRLSKLSEPRKTIYVMHAPPLGTNLDVVFSLEHVGSSAIRNFIIKKQPLLALHGHIHESLQMTGKWKDTLGDTIMVNPGKGAVVVFDPEKPGSMKLIR